MMAVRKRWYYFWLNPGRYWSIGWSELGFHILTPPVAVSWSSPQYVQFGGGGRTGWLFSWSFDRNHAQGDYIHKYHWGSQDGWWR